MTAPQGSAGRNYRMPPASLPIPNPRRSRREQQQPSEAVPSTEEVGSTPHLGEQAISTWLM